MWQIINQSVNVAINSANANKSTPLSTSTLAKSYLLAVSASCSVALGLNSLVPRLKRLSPMTRTTMTRLIPWAAVASAGALNVFLMRGEEIKMGIDVYPALTEAEKAATEERGRDVQPQSLGKSKKAAILAVSETAISRVLNSTPVMAVSAIVLVRLQRTQWLQKHPRLTLPVNLGWSICACLHILQNRYSAKYIIGLIFATSVLALPPALGAFPQRQAISSRSLEPHFWGKGGKDGLVEFNRGI